MQSTKSKNKIEDPHPQEERGLELQGLIANAANAEQSLKASKVYFQQIERSNQNSKFSCKSQPLKL